mgnify:CR=1 FL=1
MLERIFATDDDWAPSDWIILLVVLAVIIFALVGFHDLISSGLSGIFGYAARGSKERKQTDNILAAVQRGAADVMKVRGESDASIVASKDTAEDRVDRMSVRDLVDAAERELAELRRNQGGI